ncbi:MAG: LamG-like jellyroll fold domain-containing protein [Cytophagales bacterium]|nr:T9SS type A sorting domain-containing protein [Bernardetiaceae bacterium]MDW8205220.1 LamG-like jellyroll fold domain-containing protein [Cytophagales bacterium]
MNNFLHKWLFAILGFAGAFLCSIASFAQIDRTFWFAAPDITSSHGHDPIFIRVTAFANPATVTISMPSNLSFTPIVLNVPANTTVSQDLTTQLAQVETPFDNGGATPTPRNTGILIQSTADIAAYYEVNHSNNPDIFALKGRNALGTQFYLPLQNVWNHQPLTIAGRSGFVVVATEDNTTVTITPTQNLEGGRTAGVPYTVTLNKGQSYAGTVAGVTGPNMPAGTYITATKPIAVTLFHDSINTSAGGCYDLAGDQIVPVNILGTAYVVVRGFLGFDNSNNYTPANPERVVIMATQAGTTVTYERTGDLTSTTVNLAAAGNFSIITLNDSQLRTSISSNKPIYVFHFSGFGCETGGAIVPPLACTGSRNVRFTRSTSEFFGVFILAKPAHTSSFSSNFLTINPSDFQSVPNMSGWVAARYINIPTSSLGVGATGTISNSQGLFHVGIINGGAFSGARYGYFSSFNSVNLGADINVAFGTTITLDAGPNGITYKWYKMPSLTVIGTNQTLTLSVFARGNYWVEVEGNDCVLRDTICIGTFEYVWEGSKDTNINDPDNWSIPCGLSGVPNCNYDIIIPKLSQRVGSHWPTIPANATFSCRDITLMETGQLNMAANSTFNVCRHFRHEGELIANASSTVRFIGTVPQNYEFFANTASGEFPNVVLNNTTTTASFDTDAYLNILDGANRGNLVVQSGSTFTFQNGHVRTQGLRELVIKNRAPNAVQGHNEAAKRFVAGRLRRYVNSLGSYDFPVGIVKNNTVTTIDNTKQGTLQGNSGNLPTWQTANYSTGIGTTTVLDFNPAHNQFVQLPATVAIAGNAPRTVEMWARLRAFDGDRGLFSLGTTGTNLRDFSLRVNNGSNTVFNFRLQFWGSDIDANNVAFALNDTWAHYALTYDGTKARFYINGTLVIDGDRNLNTQVTTQNYLARWLNSYMNGQIDEVRIWNVARTQSQIDTWRNQKIDRCNPPAGLIAYYDFEEGSGNVINHRNATCSVEKQYQLANVNFTTASGVDNLLAFFNQFSGAPPTLSGLPLICSANYNCQMLNHGFWTINAYNSSGTQITTSGNYNMTLYNRHYTNFGQICSGGNTISTTIVRRANGSSPWQAGTGFCISDNPNNTARGGMSGFSDFGIGQSPNNALLPVELISFTAEKRYGEVLLKWQTVSEVRFSHFEVEKSQDGSNFAVIAQVLGQGVHGGNYVLTDTEPRRINYYRLKMIDKDGTFEYSRIVAVVFDDLSQTLRVYPNPLTAGKGFFVGASVEAISQIAVHNLLGQLVYQGSVQAIADSPDAYVPVQMSAGIYLVQVTNRLGEVQTVRLVVQ